MESRDRTQRKLARVARELGAAMRKQAGGRWGTLRMARRNLGNRHIWRFRTGGGAPDRFLLLSNRTMIDGEDPASRLLGQLEKAGWLDRMERGPETAFMLASGGRLQGRPRR